ncbi:MULTISPECIES: THUMP domain-containing class I SAM-dependent RNA methyltransferase [unclassified Paracoccus (in: a-proteobacteria)]|uniref:THUMP domain-containing class I SAM-dependent RNA methyltransferase n=1 Tax=unclassified Paracoccus (in: a-proteobacteria) TaxID=2688777 RepID=UPI0018A6C24B|nr:MULTISPECIES: class I SAM-dependent RNA methyltransferase [unclassified Paracoccus (in: a-proteobacteria)]UXU76275.1 class I SAM-dependent RNA methyltransferase [Paracoccus sp. SMMA_5]UXU82162.1 class I SAM-dependent RNA methyltransferase [Paracoccus sp. SMMA_5_TC]
MLPRDAAPDPAPLAADPARMEIFLVATPGLEEPLAQEARALGLDAQVIPGGVGFIGGWPEVWRANLALRGATRVLARIGAFRALHPAQLDKRARRFPWADWLRPDVPVRVEATSRKSRIYHAGAIAQRIEAALRDSLGVELADDAPLTLKVRIEDDLCTLSLDTSGESLHKRGHKQAVGKAPLRETMAAMFLRQCGFDGTQPVLDPMCGSGTFPIEAAEIAAGLLPGRQRGFAFELLPGFDAQAWAAMRAQPVARVPGVRFFGSDRDAGAIRMSEQNAQRAGVDAWVQFRQAAIADLERPEGPPGLVMINPPYGARIGNKGPLFGLHAALGEVLRQRFQGWRVGMVTSEAQLARATGLPFAEPGPYVAHGGLKVRLWQSRVL